MAGADADAAARVIERLLADPSFRADFRRDPAAACRAAGLDELADEMALGAGKAMQTLEIRESRSSLAGVMMAAALEGVGAFAFAQHVVPGALGAPDVVRDVLSRVNLPKVEAPFGELRGALAQAPPAPAGTGGSGDQAAAAAPPPAAASPAPVPAPAPAQAGGPGGGGAGADAPDAGGPAPEAGGDAGGPAPGAGGDAGTAAPAAPAEAAPAAATAATNVRYEVAPPTDAALPAAPAPGAPADAAAPGAPADAAPPAAAPEPAPSGAPVDPAQFGAEGTGGAPDAAALALLDNKNVVLDGDGVADIKAGRIDPRVVAVLTKLSEEHKITVSCMCSDHAKLTAGGSVSNHHFGRGMDIAAIDGAPVNAGNPIAREVATELSSLDPSVRPDEIGTPWAISGPGYFTDADHNDHLHVAFKQAIEPSWTPPAGQAAPSAAAPVAPAVAGAPGPAAPGGAGTLAIAVPDGAGASKAAPGTMSFDVPEPGGAARTAPDGAAAQPPGAGAAAEQLVAGGAAEPAAGARALAALAEAMKYKGTAYQWGGSTPQTGFDCSGLVQWAYAKQGIEIPRVTDQQILATNGSGVDRKALAPGDLVFFRDPSGYVHHVGISMGGDTFLHAPHTGDVVKESSLDEPYYAQQFAGGRRFDDTPVGSPAATPAPAAVDAAGAALARDAAAARSPNSMIFKALTRQEASHHSSTVRFLRAVRPEEAPGLQRAAAAAPLQPAAVAAPFDPAALSGALEYPGDGATKQQLAAWLAAHAQKAGLPPELPVMAALVESGVANLSGGHADSVGFFQMRVGIWNQGEYAGYPENPELQVKWFIDHALAVKQQRVAAGDAGFGTDPATWGNWIADVERPAEQFRGRYQLRLAEARALLGGGARSA